MHRDQGAALLESYPRQRPELPIAYRESYTEHYQANRAGAGGLSRVVARLESWMHRRVAEGVPAGDLLELGAGNLNHVPYHRDVRIYDVVEPFRELWEQSPYRENVRHIYSDLSDIPDGQSYDCILSVAVLEHLTDLPFVVARSAMHLRPDATFRAGIPSEGGMLWGLAWRLTTGVAFRIRRGLSYGTLMRHEHVNSAGEILGVLRYFFESMDISRFPLPFAHLSFYTAVVAARPRLDRCRSFCEQRSRSIACRP